MIILQVLLSLLASWITYTLTLKKNVNAIEASALTTLFLCSLLYAIHFFFSLEVVTLTKVIFGATFVGMSSPARFKSKDVLFASLIYMGVFIFLYPKTPYQGGALGTAAFTSVLLLYLFKKCLLKFGPNSKMI